MCSKVQWTMGVPGKWLGVAALFVLTTAYAWADDNEDLQRKLEEAGREDVQDGVRPEHGLRLPSREELRDGQAPSAQLTVMKFVLQGSTVLSPEDQDRVTEPFRGRPLQQADLEALAAAITKHYHGQGYFLSAARIGRQTVTDGTLTIEIEEGHVAELEISSALEHALRPYFADVLAERPLTLETLERALLIVDDLEGLDVEKPKLARLKDTPGAYRMAFEAEQERDGGRLTLDNRGDNDGGPLSLTAQIWGTSLAQTGDELELTIATVLDRPKEDHFAQLSWEGPLDHTGTTGEVTVSANGGQREALWSEDYGQFSGWEAEVTLSHPILRSRKESLWGSLEAGISRDRFGGHREYVSKDQLLWLAPSVIHQSNLSDKRWVRTQVKAAFGRDSFDPDPPALKSGSNGKAFAALTVSSAWYESLSPHWSLMTRIKGQWAGGVPDDFEFSVGGGRYGRAYDYGELDGPVGAAGATELRYTQRGVADWLQTLRLFAFADAGAVWGPNGAGEAEDLASAGVGAKAWLAALITAEIVLAQPLNARPDETGDRAPRVFFEIGKEF